MIHNFIRVCMLISNLHQLIDSPFSVFYFWVFFLITGVQTKSQVGPFPVNLRVFKVKRVLVDLLLNDKVYTLNGCDSLQSNSYMDTNNNISLTFSKPSAPSLCIFTIIAQIVDIRFVQNFLPSKGSNTDFQMYLLPVVLEEIDSVLNK